MTLPLWPKKEHKQIVQHIMVMMKMKVENRKKGTYRENERRIEDGRVGANKEGVFAIGELLIRRPINQFFQQQIIQSSLLVLCLSTPAIFSKHTHLFLSLFKVLQLGFTETFDFFFFFWETNTQKEEEKEVLTQSHTTTLLKSYGKVTDKVLVRCIFIHSRT